MADKSTFDNVWTKIGGRKLIAFALGLIALVSLALTNHLSETAMWGILGLAACFSGGNIGEHISSALRARATAVLGVPNTPSVETPDKDTA